MTTRTELFLTLELLTDEQVIALADALERDGTAACLVDPAAGGILAVFTACKDHSADIVVVFAATLQPVPMRPDDAARLNPWARDVFKRACSAWKERHPVSQQTRESVVLRKLPAVGDA